MVGMVDMVLRFQIKYGRYGRLCPSIQIKYGRYGRYGPSLQIKYGRYGRYVLRFR